METSIALSTFDEIDTLNINYRIKKRPVMLSAYKKEGGHENDIEELKSSMQRLRREQEKYRQILNTVQKMAKFKRGDVVVLKTATNNEEWLIRFETLIPGVYRIRSLDTNQMETIAGNALSFAEKTNIADTCIENLR